jgi:hypothetical protein
MYSIDWDKLTDNNLPGVLHKPALIGLIEALQEPLRQDYAAFTLFKQDTDIRIAHDGRVFKLRKRLNDKFDNTLRRITIVDVVIPDDHYIGNKQSINQSYLPVRPDQINQFYIGNAPVYFGSYDFIVNVPDSLQDQDVLIRREIEVYKFAGKTYQINYIAT